MPYNGGMVLRKPHFAKALLGRGVFLVEIAYQAFKEGYRLDMKTSGERGGSRCRKGVASV